MFLKKIRQSQGGARFVSANSRFVEAPYASTFDFEYSDTWAVSFWINSASAIQSRLIAHQLGNVVGGAGWAITIDTSGRISIQYTDGAGGFATVRNATARPAGSGWFNIIVQKIATNPNSQASYEIWMNGHKYALTIVADTYNTAISCTNSENLRIGGYATQYATMYFRDLMIWKGSNLSQYQIRNIYNAGLSASRIYTQIGTSQILIPDYHIMQYPECNQLSGTTYFFRNELNGQYEVYGNPSTVDLAVGTERINTSYLHRGKGVKLKNTVNYLEYISEPYYLYLKTAGGGSSYSRGASVEKMVGNGAIKFINATIGTSVRHTYMGISKNNTLSTTISDVNLEFVAGFGNGTYNVYNFGTTTSLGTASSYRVCRIEVDFDADVITVTYTDLQGNVSTTYTCPNAPSTLFPNKEWYVVPYTFYNNDDVNYRQMYYMAWDFNVQNSGYLTTNNLV